MNKAQAVKEFKWQFHQLYIDKVDYWTAFEAWDNYTDTLCKNGTITQHQRNTWSTPFPYGKNLKPTKGQLEIAFGGII